jgi:hypothetical protein
MFIGLYLIAGAVEILQNIDDLDFNVLFSGKVCVDEVNRVHRLARKECIRLPTFLDNIEKYKKKLRHIALLNQIPPKPDSKASTPPAVNSPILSTPNILSSNLTDSTNRRQIRKKKSTPSPTNDKQRKKSTRKLSRKSSRVRASPDAVKKQNTDNDSSESVLTPQDTDFGDSSIESIVDLNLDYDCIRYSREGRLLNRQQSSSNKLR